MKTFLTKQIERMKANPRNTVIGLLIVVLIIFVNTLSIMGNNKNFAGKGHKLVTVSQGMTAGEIADLLHKEKLVQHPDIFLIEASCRPEHIKLTAAQVMERLFLFLPAVRFCRIPLLYRKDIM